VRLWNRSRGMFKPCVTDGLLRIYRYDFFGTCAPLKPHSVAGQTSSWGSAWPQPLKLPAIFVTPCLFLFLINFFLSLIGVLLKIHLLIGGPTRWWVVCTLYLHLHALQCAGMHSCVVCFDCWLKREFNISLCGSVGKDFVYHACAHEFESGLKWKFSNHSHHLWLLGWVVRSPL